MNAPLDLRGIARGVPDVDLLRALAATNRPALERMIAISIDILDALDPDPDIEEDDPCGAADEDEYNTVSPADSFRRADHGPGCIISDEGL